MLRFSRIVPKRDMVGRVPLERIDGGPRRRVKRAELPALLLCAFALAGCMRPPPPFWETDPSLAGTYPPQQPMPTRATGTMAPPSAPAPPSAATTPTPAASPASAAGHPSAPAREKAKAAQPKQAEIKAAIAVQPFNAPVPTINAAAPAMKYANLSPAQCRKELAKRKLPVKAERGNIRGIANPVRIKGHFNEVRVIKPAAPSPFGLLDCRLVLALDDLTQVLQEFGIRMIYIGSMYRKGARIAHRGTRSQHSYGLAMDILMMRHADGTLLKVERDWHASIGEAMCGPKAVMHDPNPSSILFRNVVCEVARRHIFHVMLTPSANRAHHDHFHFDIKRDAKYQTVR
jgi:hypothetical protein